jgi:hypothetical protein
MEAIFISHSYRSKNNGTIIPSNSYRFDMMTIMYDNALILYILK